MCCDRKDLVPFPYDSKKLWECKVCGKLYKVVLSVYRDGYESKLVEAERSE